MEQLTSTDISAMVSLLKLNRGIVTVNSSMDTFYEEKVSSAVAQLLAEDIAECSLKTEYGKRAVVYLASLIIEKKDMATDPTMTLMRNTLAAMTKGDRYSDD